jgi:2-polyprenyl-6-methoxyphenol hydroxylase-like FAD-dependent oxidoreductase
VNEIDMPFVTAISDCISPQASFYDGKLFLVGDALALFRPHVAQSTNQSALHCLLLEKLLQGRINLEAYEEQVMMYAHTTLLWSREVGSQYLYSSVRHLYHKLRSRLARALGYAVIIGLLRSTEIIFSEPGIEAGRQQGSDDGVRAGDSATRF